MTPLAGDICVSAIGRIRRTSCCFTIGHRYQISVWGEGALVTSTSVISAPVGPRVTVSAVFGTTYTNREGTLHGRCSLGNPL